MEPEPRSQQIDEVEEFIINAIRQASKKKNIPSRAKSSIEKPWVNQEYQECLLKHSNEKDPTKRKSLANKWQETLDSTKECLL